MKNKIIYPVLLIFIIILSFAIKHASQKGNPIAILKEGILPIHWKSSFRYGPDGKKLSRIVKEVKLVRIWTTSHKQYLDEFLNKKFNNPKVIYTAIKDKAFYLLIINGAISPLILDMKKWELWEINGLNKGFENTMEIYVNNSKLYVSKVWGDADITRKWTLDFSNPVKGLQIQYDEIFGY